MFMEEKNKDGEPPNDRSLITRILEFAIVVALSGYLIRLGICYVLSVKWVLLILLAVAAIAAVVWHIWKNHRDTRW